MVINSTGLFRVIKQISAESGDHVSINIAGLAVRVGMTLPKLISVLTELEHRDQIILDVKTFTDPDTGELTYEGAVRMMEMPPDQIEEEKES